MLASQQAIWAADRASVDPAAFLSAQTTELPDDLQPEVFAQACQIAVRQTEMLRLRMTGLAARFVAAADVTDPAVRLLDLTECPDPNAAANAWLDGARRVAIDPMRAAPFDWTLLQLGPNRFLWSQISHHVAFDATGRHLVASRVAAIYQALLLGWPPPTPEQPPQFADLVAEEQAYFQSSRYRDDAAWCLAQCVDLPTIVSLSRRPATMSLTARRTTRLLESDQTDALRRAARHLGISLPQLLCAAWAALLGRLTGQFDQLIGLQVAARRSLARTVPATTTNQLPLRLTAATGAKFAELAVLTGRQFRLALRHQHYPHTHLRRALGLTPSDPDPMDIGFNFLPWHDPVIIDGRPLVTRNLSHGPVRDMTLAVEEELQGGLRLDLDANRDRYKATEVDRLLERLTLVLDSLCESRERVASILLADLPIMMPYERDLVTSTFSNGDPAPSPATVAALVAAQIARTPEQPALHAGSVQLSYGELGAQAAQIARHLLAKGLGPGDVAALALPRTADLVVTLLACSFAGIAVCPLDTTYPPDRTKHMLTASGAKIVLGTAALGERLEGIPILPMDSVATRDAVARQTGHPIAEAERPAAIKTTTIAYIAFTSGSTGRPKGVAVAQAAIAQQVRALRQHIRLDPGDSVICTTTITFDVAMADLFLGLISGATLVLLDEQEMRDPAAIRDAVLAHPAPLLQATPSVWRSLPLETLPSGLSAVFGGEPFPADLLPRLMRLRAVFNVYGPTETTVWATLQRLDENTSADEPIPVGRPIAGYRVWILDTEGHPLPIDGIGELCIGGPAVSNGYLTEPALTDAAFVAAPFGTGLMYRTGDLARWREDGAIELLGRRDQQVKIAGHRIEIGEIERALRDQPWVEEVAVMAHRDGDLQRLVAYIVPSPGARVPDVAALRRELSSRLPLWMLPGDCVALAALPHTSSGKIDRRALQSPVYPRAKTMPNTASSPMEARVQRLFAQVIGRATVAVDDDFFQIGGDSLAAMILLTELAQAGHDVSLPMLLAQRTPAAIAAGLLSETHQGHSGQGAVPPNATTVFLIPGMGGDSPDLAEFRAACASEIGFVLLDYPDWAALLSPDFDMCALAAGFAARIKALAPSGPILLSGYSLGGLVAWAVALALRASGCELAGLLLIDTSAVQTIESPDHPESILARAVGSGADLLRDIRDVEPGRATGRTLGRRLARARHLHTLRALAKFRRMRVPSRLRYWLRFHISRELHLRLLAPWRGRMLARSKPLRGLPTILFRATQHSPLLSADMGWGRYGVALRVIEVAGDHYSILRECGAGTLRQGLAKAAASLVLKDNG